jgi:hypothetical protein
MDSLGSLDHDGRPGPKNIGSDKDSDRPAMPGDRDLLAFFHPGQELGERSSRLGYRERAHG